MFQELEFHMPRVQTSSYHIYERDSAGDEALRDCWSPKKTLSICDLGGCLGNLSPVTLIDIYINLIGFLKPSYFYSV